MRRWDEVVHANSARPKELALEQSPQSEQRRRRRHTTPIECEGRKTASSAILLLSDLFRKEFLRTTANSIASRMTEFSSTLTHRLTSNIVGHRAVEIGR